MSVHGNDTHDYFDEREIDEPVPVHAAQLRIDTPLIDGDPIMPWIGTETVLGELRNGTQALAGRPGWRVDPEGREWYSAAWL